MIWFFRDFLDGWLYVLVAVLSLIFILAIIGFIMERLQLEQEEKNRMAVIGNDNKNYLGGGYVDENDIAEATSNTTPNNPPATAQSVVPPEVIQKSEAQTANNNVPSVLDFDQIEEKEKQ